MKVELYNVTKKIKEHIIVNNVSISLQSPGIVGLKGANGAGKTILMRLISGLVRPTEGHIMIDDKKSGSDIEFPESIGIMIEKPSFLDTYSGFYNLKILASLKGKIKDDEISKNIDLVGLDPLDNKKYKKYSLGMKQKLGIAAAIMEKPDLLILDEPTNALDEQGISMVQKILVNEKLRGALIIISSHDSEAVRSVALALQFPLLCGDIMRKY